MNPAVSTAVSPPGPPINFLNVGYFFHLIYSLYVAITSGTFSLSSLNDTLSVLWLIFCLLSFLLCLACIGALVYYSTRLYQVAAEEDERYETMPHEEAHAQVEHSRWSYIRQLIESPHESDWRQAIIEADIMLDELLTKLGLGFVGDENVGEKLKAANPDHFHTLQDAWEAHRVRNEIAHQGSAYHLTDHLAYRTIGHYENVFREFNEI